MKFKSTRGAEVSSFSEAFNQGLASDGGLFVPEYFPNIAANLDLYGTLTYPQLVAEFLSLFAEEIKKDEWLDITERAYSSFSVLAPDKVLLKELILKDAPKVNQTDEVKHAGQMKISVLELFHGPTLAFKDFALQVVGKLYERECLKYGKTYTILGATSGDTGSAAIHGVLGNDRVNIFMMYPEGKIAREQELQITTTGAQNVFPIAIAGTFDDAQAIVKEVFADKEFATEVGLAAVNSINIARILTQSVYYLFTYLKIKRSEESNTHENKIKNRIRFIVPTGNFGNVLSGWFLNNMGLDCDFVLATNQNDVLNAVWQTGEYKKKDAKVTHAPSMDIQQASNFERLLYFMYDKDSNKVKDILNKLKENGSVKIDTARLPKSITSISSTDIEIEEAIKTVYEQYGYILDPHTACAYKGIGPAEYHNVILATASPAKFPKVVEFCTGVVPKAESLEVLKSKETVSKRMNANTEEIKEYVREMLSLQHD